MPIDEATTAIARRSLDTPESDGGIDPRLAEALIEAIVAYPTFRTACAACGVSSKSVKSMLERGAQVGAPRSLRDFAKRLARADADNARDHYEAAMLCVKSGRAAEARIVLQMLERRWSSEDDNDVMAMLTSGKPTTNLRARLERPSAMLTSILVGMLKSPNESWGKLLEAAGWVRALSKPADPEPEPEREKELEPDGGGD